MLILPSGTARWIIEAATVCGLSLLPAVLLHLSAENIYRSIAAVGYVLGFSATPMHFAEGLLPGLALYKLALWIITALAPLPPEVIEALGSVEDRGRADRSLAMFNDAMKTNNSNFLRTTSRSPCRGVSASPLRSIAKQEFQAGPHGAATVPPASSLPIVIVFRTQREPERIASGETRLGSNALR